MTESKAEGLSISVPTLEESEIIINAIPHPEIKKEHQYTKRVIEHLQAHADDFDFTSALLLNLFYQARALSPFSAAGDDDFPLTLEQALDRKKSNCYLLPLVVVTRMQYAAKKGLIGKNRYSSYLTSVSYQEDFTGRKERLSHSILVVRDNTTGIFHSAHSRTAFGFSGSQWNEEVIGKAMLRDVMPYPRFVVQDPYSAAISDAHYVSPEDALAFNMSSYCIDRKKSEGLEILSGLAGKLPPNHPIVLHIPSISRS